MDVGSVALNGNLRLGADQLAQGEISLSGSSNFDDLSPLVLMKLEGALDAKVSLSASNGGQDALITARGARFGASDIAVRNFETRLTLQDLYRRPMIDGLVSAEALTAGGQTYSNIRFVAQGTPEASRFTRRPLARASISMRKAARSRRCDADRAGELHGASRRPAPVAGPAGIHRLAERHRHPVQCGDRGGSGPGGRIGHHR